MLSVASGLQRWALRNVFEKLEDCETILKLVRVTPAISLHIPWDRPDNPAELLAFARSRGRSVRRLCPARVARASAVAAADAVDETAVLARISAPD